MLLQGGAGCSGDTRLLGVGRGRAAGTELLQESTSALSLLRPRAQSVRTDHSRARETRNGARFCGCRGGLARLDPVLHPALTGETRGGGLSAQQDVLERAERAHLHGARQEAPMSVNVPNGQGDGPPADVSGASGA